MARRPIAVLAMARLPMTPPRRSGCAPRAPRIGASPALAGAAVLWTLALAGAARAQAPDEGALGYPSSVRIEADVWGSPSEWPGADPGHPQQRFFVERHPEWARSRLEDWLGDLGWSLSDARLDAADESLALYPAKKSGQLSSTFLDNGYLSLEPQATPTAWLRVMRWADKGAGSISTRAEGGSVVYAFDSLDGRSAVQVHVDAAAHALTKVVVSLKGKAAVSTYEYLDDAPLAGEPSLHHPRRVRFQVTDGGTPKLRLEARLTKIEVVPKATRPPRPAVPRDFRVTDLRTGEVFDGSFVRVESGAGGAPAGTPGGAVDPLAPGPTAAPSQGSVWMIVAGAGLIAIAGIVWQVRRRAR
jgi:hypothetical protein